MSNAVISVEGLSKCYRLWSETRPTSLADRLRMSVERTRQRLSGERPEPLRREIWALRDASFEVPQGEVLGVIGPNGAGKSTLLSILARITEPSGGQAVIRGRVSSLLEVGTGFHPELSGRDNVFLNGAVLGMTRAETQAKFDEIVEFSGIEEFIDVPVKRFSSGMYVRLAFAVAAHLDPEVLLLDEVLAVGDRAFQTKCIQRISEMTQSGRTVLFVSHDLTAVQRLCKRVIFVNHGTLVFDGPADAAIERYVSDVESAHTLTASTSLRAPAKAAVGESDQPAPSEAPVVGGRAPELPAIRVSQLAFRPLSGDPVFRPAEPTIVSATLERRRPGSTDDLDLRIDIVTEYGVHLVTLRWSMHGLGPLASLDLTTPQTVGCVIDELPFKPGVYRIEAVLEKAGAIFGDPTPPISFTVAEGGFLPPGVSTPANLPSPLLTRHRWVSAAELAALEARS